MKTMTATEASRSFAALLDQVEHGETILVTRGGHTIARIEPAQAGNGATVAGLLMGMPQDPGYAEDLREVRALLTNEEPAWGDD